MERPELILRPEAEADHRAVEELVREAFWNHHGPGCDEHYLVHVMRPHPDYVAALSFVAEAAGRLVGSLHFTRSRVVAEDGATIETLTFGPLAVRPDCQRRGIGSALVRHALARIDPARHPAVLIFGDPGNYVGLGFRSSREFRIGLPGPVYPTALLARVLDPAPFAGRTWTFHESPVYTLDPSLAAAFDAGFPAWEKGFRPSQVHFQILRDSVLRGF